MSQLWKPGNLPDWDGLAKAAETISVLEKLGVKVKALAADPRTIIAIQLLIDKGYTIDQIQATLAAMSQLWKPGNLPDWDALAKAADTISVLEKLGVNVKAFAAEPRTILVIQQLIGQGYAQQQLRDMLAAISQFGKPANLPKDWIQVAGAYTATTALKTAGVNIDALVANPQHLVAIQQLIEKGYTQQQLREVLAAVSQFWKPESLPKDWSRVAVAFDLMNSLVLAGVDVEKLRGEPALAATIQQLIGNGLTPDQILAAVRAYRKRYPAGAPLAGSENDGDWPPMISLKEADGYFFRTSEAALSKDFKNKLHWTIVPNILRIMKEYNVNVIEVTGNTDERSLCDSQQLPARCVPPRSNLDRNILPVVRGALGVDTLAPGDNAGLGLARAIAVVKELMADSNLAGTTIIPLSAAQLVDLSGKLIDGTRVGDIPERRRIEIRLRRGGAIAQ